MFVKIFQVSADKGMGKYRRLVEFSTKKLFQLHFDVTTMLTCSLANKPLGQLERAYYLIVSY